MKVRALFLASIFLVATSASADSIPSSWPKKITASNGFQKLGRAIAQEPGFPKNGNNIEKARYVMSRLPDIAKTYSLTAGTGSLWQQFRMFLTRTWDDIKHLGGGGDPENAAALKGPGKGNCGEWSFAFSEMLGGAGVTSRVVFGDNNPKKGHSAGFTGTDTAVLVTEQSPTSGFQRRIFDPFQAGYFNKDTTAQPTPDSVKVFSDIPMTKEDVTKEDKGGFKVSWKEELVGKKYIKDATEEELLEKVEAKGASPRQDQGFLLGKIFNEDKSPAKGIQIQIKGEKGQTLLTSQNDGDFTAWLAIGEYEVAVLLPNGEAGPAMNITIKNGEKTPVEFAIAQPEIKSKVLGAWAGTSKITSYVSTPPASPSPVGTIQPFDIEIIPNGANVAIKTSKGPLGEPALINATMPSNNHLHVEYSGPNTQAVKVPNTISTNTLSYVLDVTENEGMLIGELSETFISKVKFVIPGVNIPEETAEINYTVNLNLKRKP